MRELWLALEDVASKEGAAWFLCRRAPAFADVKSYISYTRICEAH
jgi:hypothetical protein